MKIFLSALLLLVISALLRFSYLGTIPVSLSHDEIDMVIQAHSFRLTGSDLSGTWRPRTLLPNDAMMAELAPLVNAPLLSLLPNSTFAAHATTALLGTLYPLLLVLLVTTLGWGSRVAWTAGILLALSPWHILFSRTSLEQPTSLFLYTLSWVILAWLFNHKRPRLGTSILTILGFVLTYALGFYTYHGFKFALPIITLVIALYHYLKSKRLAPLILVGLVIGALFLRLYVNRSVYQSRGSEIIFLDSARFSKQVDHDRRISLLPSNTLTHALTNKVTAISSTLVDKYLSTLNPTLIFARGEANGVFGTGRTGYLYLILLPFVIIGLAELLRFSRPNHTLLFILLLLAPLATVIHVNNAIAFRSAIYFVLLTVLAAVGITSASRSFPKLNLTNLVMIGVLFSTLHFVYIYLAYYPVESARAYFQADRILGSYLSRRTQGELLVIDPQPRYIMSYLVLTHSSITPELLSPLLAHYSPAEEQNIYHLPGITIRRDCPPEIGNYQSVIVDSTLRAGIEGVCPALLKVLSTPQVPLRQITDPLDGGDKKLIYNDQVCPADSLSTYLNPKTNQLFALDSLSNVQFCQSWITQH